MSMDNAWTPCCLCGSPVNTNLDTDAYVYVDQDRGNGDVGEAPAHRHCADAEIAEQQAERRAEDAIEDVGNFSSVTLGDEALEAMRERVSAKGRR